MKVLPFPSIRPEPEQPSLDEQPTTPPPFDTVGSDGSGPRYDRVTVRAITLAIVLSLFVHVVLLLAPLLREKDMKEPAQERGPLSVTIAEAQSRPPPKGPKPAPENPPPPAQAQPTPTPTPVRPQVRPAPSRPRARIAIPNARSPLSVPPPQPQVAPSQPAPEQPQAAPQPAPTDDFASVVAARQRARRAANGGSPDEVVESDDERAKRIALANIQAQQRRASPEMVDGGGGMFSLDRTGLHDADFVFNGWSTDFRRNTGLSVHVDQGSNSDIKIAVVRRMIQIIRERKPGDFEWYSPKRGKPVTMSARPEDSARLEAFLLHEFYPEDPRGRDAK